MVSPAAVGSLRFMRKQETVLSHVCRPWAQHHAWHRGCAQKPGQLSPEWDDSRSSLCPPQSPHWALLTCDLAVTVHIILPRLKHVTLEGRDLAWPSGCLLDSWTLRRLSSGQESITASKWVHQKTLSAATSWVLISVASMGATHFNDFYQAIGWLSLKPHQQTGIAWVVLL